MPSCFEALQVLAPCSDCCKMAGRGATTFNAAINSWRVYMCVRCLGIRPSTLHFVMAHTLRGRYRMSLWRQILFWCGGVRYIITIAVWVRCCTHLMEQGHSIRFWVPYQALIPRLYLQREERLGHCYFQLSAQGAPLVTQISDGWWRWHQHHPYWH